MDIRDVDYKSDILMRSNNNLIKLIARNFTSIRSNCTQAKHLQDAMTATRPLIDGMKSTIADQDNKIAVKHAELNKLIAEREVFCVQLESYETELSHDTDAVKAMEETNATLRDESSMAKVVIETPFEQRHLSTFGKRGIRQYLGVACRDDVIVVYSSVSLCHDALTKMYFGGYGYSTYCKQLWDNPESRGITNWAEQMGSSEPGSIFRGKAQLNKLQERIGNLAGFPAIGHSEPDDENETDSDFTGKKHAGNQH